jgi:O-antigen/teichoic acid export membrane protein
MAQRYKMPQTLRHRFLSGSIWSFLSIVATQGINFIVTIIIARLIGAEKFGLYGIIVSMYMMLSVFSALGFQITLAKYIAEYRISENFKVNNILSLALFVVGVLSITLTFVVWLLSGWIAAGLFHSSNARDSIVISLPLLTLLSFNTILNGALAGFENFKGISKISLIRGLIYIPLILFLVHYDGQIGPLIALMIVNSIVLILSFIAVGDELKKNAIEFTMRWHKESYNAILQYSVPAFLAGIVSSPVYWISQDMLTNLKNGYHEVGILNAANQWQQLIMLIPTTLASVALPMLSFVNKLKSEQHSQTDIITLNQNISILFIFPIAITFFVLNGFIMKLYGTEFEMGNKVLVFLILGISISGIGYPAGTMIQAKGRMWLGFVMNLTWGISLLAFTYAYYRQIGAMAYSVGFSIAHFLLLSWGYIYISKSLPKGMLIRTFLMVGLLVSIALLSIYLDYPLKFFLLLFIPVILYFYIVKYLGISVIGFIRSRFLQNERLI